MSGREQGFALMAVLVTLAVVAALAAAALAFARSGAESGIGHAAAVEGGSAADAGLQLAALRLADTDAPFATAPPPLAWLGWQVSVAVEDEGGKIDVNWVRPPVVAAALARLGIARAPRPRRGPFVSVDDLAGDLDLPAGRLPELRRVFTTYGGNRGATGGGRSAIETYRLVASARRGRRVVTHWAIVRLSPGFGQPFEWLERGGGGGVTQLPSNLPGS